MLICWIKGLQNQGMSAQAEVHDSKAIGLDVNNDILAVITVLYWCTGFTDCLYEDIHMSKYAHAVLYGPSNWCVQYIFVQ